MTLEIRPIWDPTGTLRVAVDRDRRELVLSMDDRRIEFILHGEEPDQFGWLQWTPPCRRVSVGEVVAHCLREWDAEQAVLEITEQAAREAARRGGDWWGAATRLRAQARSARNSQRLAVLPFQLLWHELARRPRSGNLTPSTAALRAGFRTPDGRGDTSRFERRLGLRPVGSGSRGPRRNTSVNYETALTLCRALGRDPVELGL
jgi:hypothetical protein